MGRSGVVKVCYSSGCGSCRLVVILDSGGEFSTFGSGDVILEGESGMENLFLVFYCVGGSGESWRFIVVRMIGWNFGYSVDMWWWNMSYSVWGSYEAFVYRLVTMVEVGKKRYFEYDLYIIGVIGGEIK